MEKRYENKETKWLVDMPVGMDSHNFNQEFPYSSTDTVHYTIYRMKEGYSYAAENLIPIYRMELTVK